MAIHHSLRAFVYQRCGGYCEKCGYSLEENTFHCHHRLRKGQRGKDIVENLIALHNECHTKIHANPKESYLYGYLVPMAQNPAEWRLTLPNGNSVRLTPSGQYDHSDDDEKEGA